MVNNYQRNHVVDHSRRIAYSIFDTIRYQENMVEQLRDPHYMGHDMGSFPLDDSLVCDLYQRLQNLYTDDYVDHNSFLPDLMESTYIAFDDWFLRYGVRIEGVDSGTESSDPSSVMDMPLVDDYNDTTDDDVSVNSLPSLN